jgi:uncharacterized protein YPO0396
MPKTIQPMRSRWMSDYNTILEFSNDDRLTGYRLKRLEVYNWGTFHERIWDLSLDGTNGLLTGDIGSGKSTLVDAITTLLVPAHRVSYNKAAGAEFKERSLKSYVFGYYKSERSDGGYSTKPVALRDRNSYSVILGTFFNEGYGQTITLAQVFWQKEAAGQPARIYIVADRELSIREHFSNFGSDIALLRKQLRSLTQVEPPFDTFPPYGAAFRRRFGLKSEQALDLFHQTVSLKSIGNLTGFVCENMLEAFDTGPRIEELINHFDDLNRAHEAVLRAKAQIEQLIPLAGHLENIKCLEEESRMKRKCRDNLRSYFAAEKTALLGARIENQQAEIDKLTLKSESITSQKASMETERDGIKQAIFENGGDRIEAMQAESSRLETERMLKLEKYEEYGALCTSLGLKQVKNSTGFIDNRNKTASRLIAVQSEIVELQNRRTEEEVNLNDFKKRHKEVCIEIDSLEKRRSNIESKQIAIRDRLCEAIGLSESGLPYAGELISVKEEDVEWEGAIERVLHNFALSLLVPSEHYTDVTQWVDDTNLRGRLVYYKIITDKDRMLRNTAVDALPAKIQIKPDTPFRDWLDEQLKTRFDYTCCGDLDMFRKVKKGLTRFGQIKGSSARHEKDDRHDIHDRRRYVLGWTNRAKIRTLAGNKRELEDAMVEIEGTLADIYNKTRTLDKEKEKLNNINFYGDWNDLDWRPAAKRIEYLKKEIIKLEKSSDTLKTLNESLARIEAELMDSESELKTVERAIATLEERSRSDKEMLKNEEVTAAESELTEDEVHTLVQPALDEFLEGSRLTIENCDKRQLHVRERLQAKIDSLEKRSKSLHEKIIAIMTGFRNDYPSETRDFDSTLASGPDFIALLHRLEADDLPKYEARFKRQLNENTIRGIAGFQAQLNKEHRQIEERIALINKSMSAIEYNKGRYIKLETLQSSDQEIRSFRRELRSCTEGSLSGADTEQYTEGKFKQVKSIVDRFKGREGTSDLDRKWTRKVTDVRNWFAFAASECWIEDNSEYEHYTDSGGKSGGQKEKLAYTVLAASLAYQFGLQWGEVRSRSFRFVVIDEAFGRGSDESTRYGLELFKQLNLQYLLITPLQKIHIIEPYISTVGFVHCEDGKESLLRSITIEKYRSEKEQQAR